MKYKQVDSAWRNVLHVAVFSLFFSIIRVSVVWRNWKNPLTVYQQDEITYLKSIRFVYTGVILLVETVYTDTKQKKTNDKNDNSSFYSKQKINTVIISVTTTCWVPTIIVRHMFSRMAITPFAVRWKAHAQTDTEITSVIDARTHARNYRDIVLFVCETRTRRKYYSRASSCRIVYFPKKIKKQNKNVNNNGLL